MEMPPAENTISLTLLRTVSPGIRAALLAKVFDDALKHCLRVLSDQNFASCFPTAADHVPESLNALHTDFIQRLGKVCKTEFAALLEEREVVQSLNDLDDLILHARKQVQRKSTVLNKWTTDDSQIPAHKISPRSLLSKHLSGFLETQHSDLTGTLIESRRTNQDLSNEVLAQSHELERLFLALDYVMRDLNNVLTSMGKQRKGSGPMRDSDNS